MSMESVAVLPNQLSEGSTVNNLFGTHVSRCPDCGRRPPQQRFLCGLRRGALFLGLLRPPLARARANPSQAQTSPLPASTAANPVANRAGPSSSAAVISRRVLQQHLEILEIDRLDEVGVEPGFLRAPPVLFLSVSVIATRVICRISGSSRHSRATSYPSMTGRPMSRRMTSGW